MRPTLGQRFWAKVDKQEPTECWPWQGSTSKRYGVIKPGGRRPPVMAHRVSWELHNGPIPDGLCVLHRCDNPPCVNPHHLFLGTHIDNMLDRDRKGRHATGERSGKARLTAAQVQEIRRLAATGLSHREVAERFGISRGHASDIVRRTRWAEEASA